MTEERIRELALKAGLANSDGCEIIIRQAIAEQREEDARKCEALAGPYGFVDYRGANACAAAIRAEAS